MYLIRSLTSLLALFLIFVTPALAQTPSWTQVGMLTCKLNPSIGFIIAGHQSMECRYVPSNSNFPPQAYQGALNMVGVNIGISAGGVLGWAVLAPTGGIPAGALAGEYVGAFRRSRYRRRCGGQRLGWRLGTDLCVAARLGRRLASGQCCAGGLGTEITSGALTSKKECKR